MAKRKTLKQALLCPKLLRSLESNQTTLAKSETRYGARVLGEQIPILTELLLIIVSYRGDCATCEIFLAGRMTKPCVAKVPAEPKLKSLKEKGLEIRV